jgi:uncharacterized membrane protein
MNTTSISINWLAALTILFTIASAVFWMVVGWRAMRAHERIADASEQTAGISRKSESVEEQAGTRCVRCGKIIPDDSKVCPLCGWTQPG